ncbi:alpha/beta hydrolase [Sphingomonas sp. NSE70-1]|uniref:Palmitoyl-protein thioesterase ABHD10, mitochondrial n=1 Tax=Sphingomonas caseinilyticus TaxID=2908205 RepID=A0ABT0RVI5_9SPHN|nr:alpha/beta hydrolase [Sphingomonas caseinilyticus]MCL6698966.1 alpha/beta hydrolase [Sphingomonas caseinilyticus]
MQFPNISSSDLAYFDPGDGRRIAYRYRSPAEAKPTIVFLPGYASDMEGVKAVAIDAYCGQRELGCLRLDYSGTGSSGGNFADGTLTRWLQEVLTAIDLVTEGPLIVAGSSMGGWLALHTAMKRPDRVKGLLGIATAPDFTDWGYTPEDKDILKRDGKLERPNPYGPEPGVTWLGFWQSGAEHRLLNNIIDVTIPIRLIHGELDTEVGLGVALQLLRELRSSDVQLRLVKNAGHRLSEPHEIHAILVELHGLVERIA